jgi:hypothetical protein
MNQPVQKARAFSASTSCSLGRSANQRTVAVCGFLFILLSSAACRHQAVISPVPTNVPTTTDLPPGQLDQVNTPGWNGAWTNLLNDAEQSFVPSLPKLVAVEVKLVVGNPGAPDDQLTLTVLDGLGQTLAIVRQNVKSANFDRVTFILPKAGIEVSPGQTYRLKLSGGAAFGWKYVVGGYKSGEATFNGKPLLAQARSTFLFRTFGAK